MILEINAYCKNNIYPVYEICLDKFNNFKRNQQTDWNKIIEENYKSQEIQSKVACSTICQKTKQIKKHLRSYLNVYTVHSEYCISCWFLTCSVSKKKLETEFQYHLLINMTFIRVKLSFRDHNLGISIYINQIPNSKF